MIYQALTNSFRLELLSGIHDLTSDSLKLALYGSSASLSESTTEYSAIGECSGSGYTAGGASVTPTITQDSIDGSIIVDFDDVTFASVSVSARGCLIYNSSKANRSIMVIDFGLEITRSSSDLTIRFPAADESRAMIRIK